MNTIELIDDVSQVPKNGANFETWCSNGIDVNGTNSVVRNFKFVLSS